MKRRDFLRTGAAGTLLGILPGTSPKFAGAELENADGSLTDSPGPRYLLLDSRVIEKTEGATLTVGTVRKHPANPLFKEDKPWEVRFDNLYPNVVFDDREGIYRCWYSPFIADPAVNETPPTARATVRYRPHDREMGICLATSRDGLRWEKPSLKLIEFSGSKDNNLVLRGPHGAGVFLDANERDLARRYKLFCRASDKVRTIATAFSPDGLHWSELHPCPEIRAAGDTHNNAFWSPDLGKYVGITRLKTDQRLVARTESEDFLHWTAAAEVLRGDKANQTYAMPVFRHAGVWLGLVMIFRTAEDRVHCELAWSPDTVAWHRIAPGHPFIANSERAGDYDWGCVYAAATPVFGESEIRLYYGASNGPHTNWRDSFLALATLRPDGFAGYEANAVGGKGTILTKPLRCAGSQLRITADVKGGGINVSLLDQTGAVAAKANPVAETVTDHTLTWSNGFDLAREKGNPIRLRFEFTGAKIFSFSLAP